MMDRLILRDTMQRLFLVLLAFMAPNAYSKAKPHRQPEEPVHVHSHFERFHEEQGITIYIDLRSREILPNGVMAWKVWNYHAPKDLEGYVFRSERVQTEYDCKTHQFRLIMRVAHEHPMGEGEVVAAVIDPRGWETIEPDTLAQREWNYFCH
ncbi:MAG: hypothetical protein RL333_2077 [Pseudomonadota bacterium]|jgi:hypothetical protein